MLFSVENKIQYVEEEVRGVMRRSQSWASPDMIFGGVDGLIVDTLKANNEQASHIEFFSAMNSYHNRPVRQSLSTDDARLFQRMRNLLFDGYRHLRTDDFDDIAARIRNADIPKMSVEDKEILVRYLRACYEELLNQEICDTPPQSFFDMLDEFNDLLAEARVAKKQKKDTT